MMVADNDAAALAQDHPAKFACIHAESLVHNDLAQKLQTRACGNACHYCSFSVICAETSVHQMLSTAHKSGAGKEMHRVCSSGRASAGALAGHLQLLTHWNSGAHCDRHRRPRTSAPCTAVKHAAVLGPSHSNWRSEADCRLASSAKNRDALKLQRSSLPSSLAQLSCTVQ